MGYVMNASVTEATGDAAQEQHVNGAKTFSLMDSAKQLAERITGLDPGADLQLDNFVLAAHYDGLALLDEIWLNRFTQLNDLYESLPAGHSSKDIRKMDGEARDMLVKLVKVLDRQRRQVNFLLKARIKSMVRVLEEDRNLIKALRKEALASQGEPK